MHRPLALALLTFACAPHQRDDAASAGMIGVMTGSGEPLTSTGDDGIGGLIGSPVVELRGVLSYRAVRTDVMSVDAYLGDRITLTTPDGDKPLVATQEVDKARLQALDGHSVSVSATWSAGAEPAPGTAAPMDGDKPMRQGAGYRVLSLVDLGMP